MEFWIEVGLGMKYLDDRDVYREVLFLLISFYLFRGVEIWVCVIYCCILLFGIVFSIEDVL